MFCYVFRKTFSGQNSGHGKEKYSNSIMQGLRRQGKTGYREGGKARNFLVVSGLHCSTLCPKLFQVVPYQSKLFGIKGNVAIFRFIIFISEFMTARIEGYIFYANNLYISNSAENQLYSNIQFVILEK